MAVTEFGTGKSIVVLAVVVGCFAILWPKIFYPMMQAAFSLTSKFDRDQDLHGGRSGHLDPSMLPPRIREAMGEARPSDGPHLREGRPFPHQSARQPPRPQPKSGGAMNIIMPIYTLAIIVFFLYTVLRLVFKKKPEDEKRPIIKDFHMDTEYRKFLLNDEYSSHSTAPKKRHQESRTKEVLGEYGHDKEDYEIYQLKKRLEETEAAMQRIMKHMGTVSERLGSVKAVQPTKLAASTDTPAEKKPSKVSLTEIPGVQKVAPGRNFVSTYAENSKDKCTPKGCSTSSDLCTSEESSAISKKEAYQSDPHSQESVHSVDTARYANTGIEGADNLSNTSGGDDVHEGCFRASQMDSVDMASCCGQFHLSSDDVPSCDHRERSTVLKRRHRRDEASKRDFKTEVDDMNDRNIHMSGTHMDCNECLTDSIIHE